MGRIVLADGLLEMLRADGCPDRTAAKRAWVVLLLVREAGPTGAVGDPAGFLADDWCDGRIHVAAEMLNALQDCGVVRLSKAAEDERCALTFADGAARIEQEVV